MTVREVRSIRELSVGGWVNIESPLRFSFAGPVGQIVRLAECSAYVQVHRSASLVTESFRIRRIKFACDTQLEAQLMFEYSLDFAKKALRHEKKLLERLDRARKVEIERTVKRCSQRVSE
jgi:hypothetical protein